MQVVVGTEKPGADACDGQDCLGQGDRAVAARLPDSFVLHDVEGHEHEEIARMLGCSVGTSKSQLHKARMKFEAAQEEVQLL